MKVYKFGGASINSIDRIKNVGNIIASSQSEKLLIIISAMGKTTNALEKVAEAFFSGRKDDALNLFQTIKQQHLDTLKYLTVTGWQAAENHLKDFFTEVEWLLHDKPVRQYDYYYDQIVCSGELMSTAMVSHYLNERGIRNTWLDVRDIIRTDDNFRDAGIDWDYTSQRIGEDVQNAFRQTDISLPRDLSGRPMKMKAPPSAGKEATIPLPYLPIYCRESR